MQGNEMPPVSPKPEGEKPADTETPKKQGKSKKLIAVLIVSVTLALGAAGYAWWENRDNSIPAPAPSASDKQAAQEVQSFTFAAAGDFGMSDNAAAVLQKIGEANVNFTLGLGDLSYAGNGSEPAWCDFVKQRVGQEHPFELIAGNHDDGTSEGNILEFRKCLPDKIGSITGDYGLEYYFDYNDLARFILISPDIDDLGFDYTKGSPHYDWLAAAIDGARSDGLKWVVLGMHKNCVTAGQKGCEIGKDLLNLAAEKKVDLILQGHEHAYMRSKQIGLSASCPEIVPNAYNVSCVTGSGSDFVQGFGPVITISGAGGVELRDIDLVDRELDYFEALDGSNVGQSHGFAKFTVSAESLKAEFVPATGTYTDTFTITAH